MSNRSDDMIRSFRDEFAKVQSLGERAAAQLDDDQFFAALDRDGNSVALVMKHVGGNLRSRWTDVFTTDGEKPDRHRDLEFEREPGDSRSSIEHLWHRGWGVTLSLLAELEDSDLARTVVIRAEPHTLGRAMVRSLAHTAGHVYQMIVLARHWRGDGWKTLSIPRGQSEQFKQAMLERHTRQ